VYEYVHDNYWRVVDLIGSNFIIVICIFNRECRCRKIGFYLLYVFYVSSVFFFKC
jgi:hypothetical protein